jgi:putative ABC transport system permease protein
LIVRTTQDPDYITPEIRSVLHEVDPLVAVDRVESVERAEYDSMASPRVMTLLLALFAALAVVISASGIAAVMALAVSQRTREIGVRMALGAQSGSIVRMVLRQGLGLALVGTILGMAGALALTRLLATLLYGTSPTDIMTFTAAPLFFLGVAAVACFIPARLVTSIDPMVALREE